LGDSAFLKQDNVTRDGGALFLGHLIPADCLKSVSSEKGSFRTNQKNFSGTSVFGQLESTIARDDDVLICDDLGDEWADFIGLNTKGAPPMITFYHAKHGKLSLGAGPFHISVSQAEKNLGFADCSKKILRALAIRPLTELFRNIQCPNPGHGMSALR
jgi:hypothetical protein